MKCKVSKHAINHGVISKKSEISGPKASFSDGIHNGSGLFYQAKGEDEVLPRLNPITAPI